MRVFVFGKTHNYQWFPPLQNISNKHFIWRVILIFVNQFIWFSLFRSHITFFHYSYYLIGKLFTLHYSPQMLQKTGKDWNKWKNSTNWVKYHLFYMKTLIKWHFSTTTVFLLISAPGTYIISKLEGPCFKLRHLMLVGAKKWEAFLSNQQKIFIWNHYY